MVANTIGAGVYTTSGFTLQDLGSRESVILVWLLASLLALTGAVSFGALARAIPKSGGEYLYLSRLIHPAAGFIAGWVSMIAAFAGAEAYAAITFKAYIELSDGLETLIALGLILLLSALQGVLVRSGTLIQNLTVLAKGLFMLLFIIFGLAVWETPTDLPLKEPGSPWLWPVSLMWVSLSFTGFNAAIYVAEECENPERDIPRALVIGTLVTATLYLLINIVFVYSAPLSQTAGVSDIALVSAQALGGETLRQAVQVLVLLSLFTLISGIAVAGPRVVVKMGEDGYLPPFSLKQAAFIQCFLAMVMTLSSSLLEQLNYLSLILSLTSALAVAAVFKLPREQRPYSVFPIVYIVGSLLGASASLYREPKSGLAALATLLSGGVVYALFFSKPGSRSMSQEAGKEV